MTAEKNRRKLNTASGRGPASGFYGFTLVELMIVLVIMVILAAAAVPLFGGYMKRAQEAVCITNLAAVSRRVTIERMMVPGLDAEAAQKMIDEENGMRKLCPNGGSYRVEKSSDSLVVSCSYHGKTPPQVVGEKIENIMAPDSDVRKLIDAYYANRGTNNLDSTGPNFGGDLKKKIASQLNISEKFEMRIWWDRTNTKKFQIYIFDPVDNEKAGNKINATRYYLTMDGKLEKTEQGTAPLIESETDDLEGKRVKFLTLDGEHFTAVK